MRAGIVLLLMLALAAVACAPASAPPQETTQVAPAVWSAPLTLAQAPQADAPALALSSGQIIAAWIGGDERGVHQDARRWLDGRWGDALTLPLPPVHPYDQRLFPAAGGSAHLLWLDQGDDGKTHLFSAFLAPDLTVQRGPVSLSDGLALSYSAVPDGQGGLWAAWSGGLLAEMSVSARHVDDAGRPLLEAAQVAEDGTCPALVRAADGAVWLFWVSGGQLMRQRIDAAGSAQAVTSAISLAPGDRLIDVRAALDTSTAYFFWNITRSAGTTETWFTAGALDAPNWPQPQRLRITVDAAARVESGLKIGDVSAASPGIQTPLRWAEPAAGQRESVLAAVESDDGLGILLMRGGQVVGYALAAPGVRLIGVPALVVGADGDVDLAWSQPGTANARLQVVSTRGQGG